MGIINPLKDAACSEPLRLFGLGCARFVAHPDITPPLGIRTASIVRSLREIHRASAHCRFCNGEALVILLSTPLDCHSHQHGSSQCLRNQVSPICFRAIVDPPQIRFPIEHFESPAPKGVGFGIVSRKDRTRILSVRSVERLMLPMHYLHIGRGI